MFHNKFSVGADTSYWLPCPLLALMTVCFYDVLHHLQVSPGMTLAHQQSVQSFRVPRVWFFCLEHKPVDRSVTLCVGGYSFGRTIFFVSSLFFSSSTFVCSSPSCCFDISGVLVGLPFSNSAGDLI